MHRLELEDLKPAIFISTMKVTNDILADEGPKEAQKCEQKKEGKPSVSQQVQKVTEVPGK